MSRRRKTSAPPVADRPRREERRISTLEDSRDPLGALATPIKRSPHVAAIVNWLFPCYVGLIAVGFLIFWKGHVTPIGGDSSDRSLFNAVNAATLTGFPSSLGVPEFLTAGQIVSALLMLAGTLFTLIVGGLAVVRICRLAISDGRIVVASVALTLLATVIGTIGGKIDGRPIGESAFLGISAFSNCGLVTSTSPASTDGITHTLLLPLAILGGLGVPVLLEMLAVLRGRSTSTHTRVTLGGVAIVYLISFAALLACTWPTNSILSADLIRSQLATASATAINARSAGFPFATDAMQSRVAVWLLMGLMSLGAGSAGAAGGLKMTTLFALFTGSRSALRGDRVPRAFGIALCWLGMYAAAIAVTQAMLLHAVPEVPGDRLLFLACSAVGNVGLAHDPVSFVGDGLYALSAGMFAGRVLPLLVLWWMADTSSDAEIAVG